MTSREALLSIFLYQENVQILSLYNSSKPNENYGSDPGKN